MEIGANFFVCQISDARGWCFWVVPFGSGRALVWFVFFPCFILPGLSPGLPFLVNWASSHGGVIDFMLLIEFESIVETRGRDFLFQGRQTICLHSH